MESLKIDRTKVRSIKNFAKEKGLTVQRIYQLINSGDIKTINIDGVQFIDIS